MNPSLKLLLVLLLSLEISFTQKLVVNLLLIAVGLGLVIATRPGLLTLLRLLVVPAIPAATLSITIGLFTPGARLVFCGRIGQPGLRLRPLGQRRDPEYPALTLGAVARTKRPFASEICLWHLSSDQLIAPDHNGG